ncbi:hemerythrin domain-containing protein [Actinomadura sp. 9N215]|uniref:hemerythrin domain-containing protein n=1 Tax=Actinomadura sp. 9N215 TaxID=3375150 RepID=UPI00379FB4CC
MHIWLRDELDSLRDELDSVRAEPDDRLADGIRPRELRAHCLTFCAALNRHHSGEEGGAFPALAQAFPELRPVLDELRRDHLLVEDSLQRLHTLLADLDEESDLTAVRRELDSLAVLMETHFVYEERRIVSALNALDMPDWERDQPDFLIGDPET